MGFAFVIGNGESRKQIPAKMWQGKETYACNYAYREFAPSNLVCCDKLMIMMALSERADIKSKLWTRKRWFSKVNLPAVNALPDLDMPYETRFDRELDWGSGTYAAYMAGLSTADILVFVGFDLWGKAGKINNVFKGEKYYGPADDTALNPEVWIHQFQRLFARFPDKQFVFLNNLDWEMPDSWRSYDNCNQDDIKEMKNL